MRPGFQRTMPFERKITQLIGNDIMEYQDDIQDSADRAEPWTNISDFTIPKIKGMINFSGLCLVYVADINMIVSTSNVNKNWMITAYICEFDIHDKL